MSDQLNPTYVPVRPRSNQPVGKAHAQLYHCRKHDYAYYPSDWETSEGVIYRAGYYDENGIRYDGILVRGKETYYLCPHCTRLITVEWKGDIPVCPSCRSRLDAAGNVDEMFSLIKGSSSAEKTAKSFSRTGTTAHTDTTARTGGFSAPGAGSVGRSYTKPKRRSGRFISLFYTGFIIAMILISMSGSAFRYIRQHAEQMPGLVQALEFVEDLTGKKVDGPGKASLHSDSFYNDSDLWPDSVYVKPLDRDCPKDSSGFYYDLETVSVFMFSPSEEPSEWLYWFYDISSYYGDYGWMKYSSKEKQWYIQTEEGWETLPSRYKTDSLWHFDNEYVNDVY